MNAIIVDDIKAARQSLRADLETYCPEVKVIGEASGVLDGLKLLKIQQPDILFLDIQMNDGSGFDLLEILKDVPFRVIFVTASDKFAVKAFKFSAVDYLLKPVDPDDLKAAVNKSKSNISGQREGIKLLMEKAKGNYKKLRKLSLHTQDKIQVVALDDIIRCESSVNYTDFHLYGGKKILVTRTLKDYEEMLEEEGFFRVHQSHLVNTKHIREFIKSDGGYLIMSDLSSVPVSSRKRAEVVQMLDTI